MYRFVKPGGFVELAEYDMNLFSDDGTYHEGTYLWKFYELVNKAANKHGASVVFEKTDLV